MLSSLQTPSLLLTLGSMIAERHARLLKTSSAQGCQLNLISAKEDQRGLVFWGVFFVFFCFVFFFCFFFLLFRAEPTAYGSSQSSS